MTEFGNDDITSTSVILTYHRVIVACVINARVLASILDKKLERKSIDMICTWCYMT